MEPISTALLAAAFVKVAETLAEKAIIDPALESGLEPFQKWLKSGYDKAKAEKELQKAFQQAALKLGKINDQDELTAWLQKMGLDRLQFAHNNALRRQVALAIVGFTDPGAQPPESLMTALGWPRSRAGVLSQFLAALREALADTSWKPMLDYADEAQKRNLLKAMLDSLEQFSEALTQIDAGKAIQVVWVNRGLSEDEAAEIDTKYRQNLLREFENLEMRGLSPQLLTSKPEVNPALTSLPLESIYLEPGLIPLRSEREHEVEWEEMLQSDDARRLMVELRQQQKRVSDVLGKSPRLVIVGKPGGGKTISLKFIALMLAHGPLGAARLRLDAPYIPIYVRLAQYAERVKDNSGLSLEKFLLESVGDYYAPNANRFNEYMQLALEKGLCMILLDGLDEVGDIGDTLIKGKTLRNTVLVEVQRFSRQRCRLDCANRILVTSRLEGYHRGDLRDFDEMELSALSLPDEVREFLVRWFAAHEQKNHPRLELPEIYQRAQTLVEPLLDDILRSASVQRLAINPLLLTILAMIYQLGTRLPNERVRLYQIVTQTMIESWRQAQTNHNISIYDVLPASRVMPMMASLAYWVHENKPGGAMPEPEWRDKIQELLLAKDDELKPSETEQLAEMFLRHAREEVGLLIERSPGQIGFFHLTLEEYLAGVEIATRRESEQRAMVNKHWKNPRWREVLLLAAGQLMLNGSQELDEFIFQLRKHDDDESPELFGLPAILAGKAISDVGREHFSRKLVRETSAELVQIATTADASPFIRVECADLADELGLPRELDNDLFQLIEVRMPSTRLDHQPAAFSIGKYPVTNAQYARFLQPENFANEALWTGFPKFAGPEEDFELIGDWGSGDWDWLQERVKQNGVFIPRSWRDDRFGIGRANAPVVGISWFEANAYCRWLLANWDELEEGKQGMIKPVVIRLPLENEWVLAAGGEAKGRFAFGELKNPKEEIPRYANTEESGIERSTPVWMYPLGASPLQVMDLSGNVWEWQANYRDYNRGALALRGGIWFGDQNAARVSFRDSHFLPRGGYNLIGFRVLALLS